MAIFYTVSSSQLELGSLSLQSDYSALKRWVIQDLFDSNDVDRLLYEHFPDGLSRHGLMYATTGVGGFVGNVWRMHDTQTIETYFELIRRLSFPKLPSRFISLFGVDDIETARAFNQNFRNSSGFIYKVEASHYLRVDMNWLNLGSTYVGINLLANKYWQGEASPKPFWEVLMQFPVLVIERME